MQFQTEILQTKHFLPKKPDNYNQPKDLQMVFVSNSLEQCIEIVEKKNDLHNKVPLLLHLPD